MARSVRQGFFFEKKKQKTSISAVADPMDKSFLVLFFKKGLLARLGGEIESVTFSTEFMAGPPQPRWTKLRHALMLSMLRMTAGGVFMATLTVRNLDEELVRRLRIRAAEHGRSAEAEHRALLRAALLDGDRAAIAERLAEFRSRTAARGEPSVLESLEESRGERLAALAGNGE